MKIRFLIYTFLFLIIGCSFFSATKKEIYIEDIWKICKVDSANNIVVYKTLKYDKENNKSIIKLKFLNNNQLYPISIKFYLNVIYYNDYFYNKYETRELGIKRIDNMIDLKPYAVGFIKTSVKGIIIKDINFNFYKPVVYK